MHPVECSVYICVSFWAAVMSWFWKMRGVSFSGVELRLESLAVIECGYGRELLSGKGAVGAGPVSGRWNPD